jgi:hypothetical protein
VSTKTPPSSNGNGQHFHAAQDAASPAEMPGSIPAGGMETAEVRVARVLPELAGMTSGQYRAWAYWVLNSAMIWRDPQDRTGRWRVASNRRDHVYRNRHFTRSDGDFDPQDWVLDLADKCCGGNDVASRRESTYDDDDDDAGYDDDDDFWGDGEQV